MIDTSHFFRFNENSLEIFVTGLSLSFTRSIKEGHENITDVWDNRVSWVCNRVREFKDNHDMSNVSTIVLDCRMENIYVVYLGLQIVKAFGLSKDNVKFLVSVTLQGELDEFDHVTDKIAELNYCYYIDDLLKENIDWESIEIDYPIMSLSARASQNRVTFTKELLDFFGDKCRVSLGINKHYEITAKELQSYVRTMHPYPFPYSQGTDNAVLETIHLMHTPPGNQLYKSVINIVHDTNDNQHDRILLTEKTFKTFAWHQIPIFVCTPGHVKMVRELGFDLFDDIIDHSYDSYTEPSLYKMKVFSEIAKLIRANPTTVDWQNLRKKLWPRIVKNNERLIELKLSKTIGLWPHYG